MNTVALIGAGYAGLACAVELARQGIKTTVFERSRTLGGRARALRKDGWTVDNGQHVLIGAYTELTRLLRMTGVSPRQLQHLPLTLHVPGQIHLRAAALPAPLHLAVGLATARGLNWRERFALAALLRHLKRERFRLPATMTVTELLADCRQPAKLRNLVWEPLCVAALNTPAHMASAQIFANILRDSLAAPTAAASELLIPRVDLSELFPVPAARYLAIHDGEICVGNAITAIIPEPEGAGFRLTGDPAGRLWPHVVIAVAPHHAAPLLATAGEACAPLAARIAALPAEPVTTVYFALGEGFTLPCPMIGLTGGPAQWAFDRGQCGGPEGLIAMVSSAHRSDDSDSGNDDGDATNHDTLIAATRTQLERALGCRPPEAQWTQVVVEKRATFACRPGLERPAIETPLPGLWLAGDYIESDYPATLEAAVRAGTRCARGIEAGFV
ncbi:MAG: hydroxysqualene dehydroxylase HpnE [Azoarcus sp.]|jgi:squalene-associated FAD-dependent desaturase|nr:hydroxysqualene dehydroxylase HpnE [Azoarcus sp.]